MMAGLGLAAVVGGCLPAEPDSSSFGVVQGTPAIKFARATDTIGNYGGIAYYQWNILLATTDGCEGDTAATLEINTPLVGSPNAWPTGAIPVRAEQVPQTSPSALVTFDAATGVSGTITIDSVEAVRIRGSFDVTTTAGPMAGSFVAAICQ